MRNIRKYLDFKKIIALDGFDIEITEQQKI